jgi:hypothetical protein
MKSRIGMAIICLHIDAVIALLVGISVIGVYVREGMVFGEEPYTSGLLTVLLPLIAFIEIAAFGLQKRQKWAWIMALVIFLCFSGSVICMPVVPFGLWGLFDRNSLRECGVVGRS